MKYWRVGSNDWYVESYNHHEIIIAIAEDVWLAVMVNDYGGGDSLSIKVDFTLDAEDEPVWPFKFARAVENAVKQLVESSHEQRTLNDVEAIDETKFLTTGRHQTRTSEVSGVIVALLACALVNGWQVVWYDDREISIAIASDVRLTVKVYRDLVAGLLTLLSVNIEFNLNDECERNWSLKYAKTLRHVLRQLVESVHEQQADVGDEWIPSARKPVGLVTPVSTAT